MAARGFEPLGFHEVEIGDKWESPARTVTETDIVSFAGLTGDYNALHIDHEFARQTPFQKPIAHGLLGISYAAGLSSRSPYMKTLAFVRILEWQFLAPVFIGDTIHVRTEVESKELRGRGKRGLIVWKKEIVNQEGKVVQQGKTETLVSAESA